MHVRIYCLNHQLIQSISIDFYCCFQIPDPDERLVKTNKKCEHFYGIFMNFLTNWSVKALAFMSVASILVCQLKYGLGEIRTESLYHPMRIV